MAPTLGKQLSLREDQDFSAANPMRAGNVAGTRHSGGTQVIREIYREAPRRPQEKSCGKSKCVTLLVLLLLLSLGAGGYYAFKYYSLKEAMEKDGCGGGDAATPSLLKAAEEKQCTPCAPCPTCGPTAAPTRQVVAPPPPTFKPTRAPPPTAQPSAAPTAAPTRACDPNTGENCAFYWKCVKHEQMCKAPLAACCASGDTCTSLTVCVINLALQGGYTGGLAAALRTCGAGELSAADAVAAKLATEALQCLMGPDSVWDSLHAQDHALVNGKHCGATSSSAGTSLSSSASSGTSTVLSLLGGRRQLLEGAKRELAGSLVRGTDLSSGLGGTINLGSLGSVVGKTPAPTQSPTRKATTGLSVNSGASSVSSGTATVAAQVKQLGAHLFCLNYMYVRAKKTLPCCVTKDEMCSDSCPAAVNLQNFALSSMADNGRRRLRHQALPAWTTL